jgi:glycosyltransferase involved in cell wall biosynthesis
MSSVHEGLPTVLIEALACGCQVVSTDCPSGPAEILENGKYGRLTSVGDDTALAEAIEATLDSPLPADRLIERANDFAPDAVIDEYEAFVHQYVEPATRESVETSPESPTTF